MKAPSFLAPVSRQIWQQKYRLQTAGGLQEADISETLWRVARAAARAEPGGAEAREAWARTFYAAMASWQFVPGGRILAGAGSQRHVTLFNCFVLGRIADDLSAICDSVKEAALTMQAGGGIGHDFSTLRPRGAPVVGVGADAAGPVRFMDMWDAMCRTILSAGQRRGAMMGTLRCDHPDIEEFIGAKANPERLRNFNLSVLVTDAFMAAVKAQAPWDLVFEGRVYAQVEARALWDKILAANYAYAEPGVIFIDRVNALNNLAYCEEIHATNPCGEQPLPAYGACLLGSINLAQLIEAPFTKKARLDETALCERVATAVRLLDNVIDVSSFPLPQQQQEARSKRRIGLGITGLADAFILLGLRYGAQPSLAAGRRWMRLIQETAYRSSADLAAEKGVFPLYDREAFLARPNVQALSSETRALIERNGIRNGCLTTIAPGGTISLLAGNVSSGIEPVFDFEVERRVMDRDGANRIVLVEDYAFALYRAMHGEAPPSGQAWVSAGELTPQEHLAMQAALQPHVDSAISKTINCPRDIAPAQFNSIYLEAYERGLKGCTTFRPNSVTGSILVTHKARVDATAAARTVRGDGAGGSAAGASHSGRAAIPGLSATQEGAGFGELATNVLDPGLGAATCPQCHHKALRRNGTCEVCPVCGYEACG